MADGLISGVVSGGKEAQAALVAMDKRVDLATATATSKVVTQVRTSIRGRMRGRPRWDRRGSGDTGPAVNLNLNPHVVKKSGGPGKLTGQLSRNVRKSKKPRPVIGGFSAVVFMGARYAPGVNRYKGTIEKKTPYFAPGVKNAEPKLAPIWEAAWLKATSKW